MNMYRHPSSQSVYFAGDYINLTDIAVASGLYPNHLSRIFSGKRRPTLNVAQKVSAALGMGLESFLEALEHHTSILNNNS